MTEYELDYDLETITPKMYKVIIHNDDYSTFDFVINILIDIFNKEREEAIELTFKIDEVGFAVVGVYPKEIAETKISLVREIAKTNNFPLLATMEEE